MVAKKKYQKVYGKEKLSFSVHKSKWGIHMEVVFYLKGVLGSGNSNNNAPLYHFL